MRREGARRRKSPVTVRGTWLPLSADFLRSRAFAELSPLAVKLLFTLAGQLGYNAKGNGDLSAAPAVLKPLGWTSKASLQATLAELLAAGLLCLTRQGSRRLCSLYALTLWPMDCDFSKLDHGPGLYAAECWRDDPAQAAAPDATCEAAWARPRKNANAPPATGEPTAGMPPPRGNPARKARAFAPAAGVSAPFSAASVPPPRGTFLDKPSAQRSAHKATTREVTP